MDGWMDDDDDRWIDQVGQIDDEIVRRDSQIR